MSLGSSVDEIKDLNKDGYRITFSHGDVCNPVTGEMYKSTVNYVCSSSVSDEDEKDYLPGMPTLESQGPCTYVFRWVSKYACAQCRSNQVETITGKCKELKFQRKYGRMTVKRAREWLAAKVSTAGTRKVAT